MGKKVCPKSCDKNLYSLISRASNEECTALIKNLNEKGQDALFECVYNCLCNPAISKLKRKSLRQSLKGREKEVLALADRNRSRKSKQRILIKSGGFFFPLLAKIALPLLGSLFGKIFSPAAPAAAAAAVEKTKDD
jgi:hypothetical protein